MASPKMQTLLKMHVNFIDKQLSSTVAGKILKARKAPFAQQRNINERHASLLHFPIWNDIPTAFLLETS